MPVVGVMQSEVLEIAYTSLQASNQNNQKCKVAFVRLRGELAYKMV